MRWLGIALVVALASCGGGGGSRTDAKQVEARIPDVEGVVDAADTHRIVIDGKRYVVADDAASVSTYTLDAVPVRVHTFVHAGLDGDTGRLRWIATIGLVSDTDPPRVRYTGRLLRERDGRAVFDDGTALRVAPDLDLPEGFVAVEIDPATDQIVTFSTP